MLKIVPRLNLGSKLAEGGVKSTGPHTVKFLEEPVVVVGKDFITSKERKELRFIVEENGVNYRWNVPILNKEGQPNYLVERLIDVEVGDERILEMVRKGTRNYIDIRKVDEAPEEPPVDAQDDEIHPGDIPE